MSHLIIDLIALANSIDGCRGHVSVSVKEDYVTGTHRPQVRANVDGDLFADCGTWQDRVCITRLTPKSDAFLYLTGDVDDDPVDLLHELIDLLHELPKPTLVEAEVSL